MLLLVKLVKNNSAQFFLSTMNIWSPSQKTFRYLSKNFFFMKERFPAFDEH